MGTTRREASCGLVSSAAATRRNWARADHAGAGKDIPAQTDTIAVFDLGPLLLQRFIVHDCADVGTASGGLLLQAALF